MRLMNHNVMESGIRPHPSRLEDILAVIREQDADALRSCAMAGQGSL